MPNIKTIKSRVEDIVGQPISEVTVNKINSTYVGWRIDEESAVAVVPLDEVAGMIIQGMTEDDIAERVAEKLAVIPPEISELKNELQIPKSIAEVEAHLFVRVLGTERNQSFLETVPHREVVPGISMTVHYLLSNTPGSIMSFPVTNAQMRNLFEFSEEELWEAAFRNAPKLFEPTIFRFMGEMFVVSDSGKINGAAAMFYPGVAETVCDKMGADIFWIAPSSTAEMVCFPKPIPAELVREINGNETLVATENILCDNVYVYSRDKGRIEIMVN